MRGKVTIERLEVNEETWAWVKIVLVPHLAPAFGGRVPFAAVPFVRWVRHVLHHLTLDPEIVRDTMTADVDEVLQSTSLTVLGVDSLDLVEMVMEFEEVFEMEFDRKRLGELETLGDVIEEITRLRDESRGRQNMKNIPRRNGEHRLRPLRAQNHHARHPRYTNSSSTGGLVASSRTF